MKRKFTRRDFLKVASIGTASAIAASCGMMDTSQPTPDPGLDSTPTEAAESYEADVLVLGAGISGLAAARTLVDKDSSVIVLEARDRIGGRMWTDTSLGLPLDLGASWIHGVDGNPIAELAQKFGVKTVISYKENGIVYNADGSEMPDAEYAKMEDLFVSIFDAVSLLQENAAQDMSLQQAFDQVIASRKLSAEELHGLQFIIEGNFALELGADPDNLSLKEWDQDEQFSGDEVVFPGGYSQIADGLAKGLDIRLGVKVTEIFHDKKGVKVKTSSGAFSGGSAIITFPLGVLKHAEVKFDPPLPKSKQSAIDRLDMGVLNKVYLKFFKAFWDESIEIISYVGEETGEWCDWLNLVPYVGEPVLMAFHGGAKGYAIEELSDDEIIAGAMKTLRVIYGKEIPEPDGFLITRWGKDPLAFGSYSHIPPFASGDDYEALFEPVNDVLYFAGEATSLEYPATVHGAYLSGVAAAGELA